MRAARLWLIRHGQTAWNLEGRYQGQADAPLNATGWEQARAVAARLAGKRYDAIYSSDLQRALTTAEVIGEAVGLRVRRHPGLREVRLGRWEGMLAVDIQRDYAEAWLARQRDPANARPPGGESAAEVAQRVWAAVDEIVTAHPGGAIIVVSHGLAVATVLCRARGVPLAEVYTLIPDNCQPETVVWEAGGG
jgi:broad specificity phosphatase PhoE